jgi:hypothetical protein
MNQEEPAPFPRIGGNMTSPTPKCPEKRAAEITAMAPNDNKFCFPFDNSLYLLMHFSAFDFDYQYQITAVEQF